MDGPNAAMEGSSVTMGGATSCSSGSTEPLNEQQYSKWKKKRHKTFISFILVGILVGIDYTVIFTTLYIYLRDVIKTDHSEVYYGFIIALYQISSAVFGVITGRWLDKTRRVKLFTNVIIILQIVGSLLYVLSSHVYFPILGRFIAGAGDPFISVCSGEVVRVYDEEEGTRALWWLASCYSLGMIVGPVIPLAFNTMDFKIGPIVITQYNFIGLFMASLFIVVLVIVNVLMHDCSREFDLKAHAQSRAADGSGRDLRNEPSTRSVLSPSVLLTIKSTCEILTPPAPSALTTIKNLFTDTNVVLLFVSTVVCMYSMFSVDELIPLLFVIILEWQPVSLAVFFMASGILYALLLFLLSKYCITNLSLYVTMVACLLGAVLMYVIIVILKLIHRSPPLDCILVASLGFFWLLTTCTEEVLIRAILARKVDSSVQSFTEALRNCVSSIAAILAALTTPFVLPVLEQWAIIMAIIVGLVIVAYVVRRKTLVRADVIKFRSSYGATQMVSRPSDNLVLGTHERGQIT